MALEFKCKHCNELMFPQLLKIGEIAKCKMCGKKNTIPKDAKTISEFSIPEKDRESKKNKTKKSKIIDNKSKSEISLNTDKYPALRFISALLKFISIVVVLISFLILIIAYNNASYYEREAVLATGLPMFIFSIIVSICMYAYGELITLFIDVEKNTRKSK